MNDNLDTDDDSDDLEEHLHCRNVSTLRSYIELMRLPNVFTAMADVTMGFLFVQASDWHWVAWWDSWTLALLLAASSLLYIAGIVLNDVFDLETDRRERPERPLPSGRVSLAGARWLGWKTLALGVVLGSAAGFFTGHLRPGIVAALLATCIVLYDAWLKRTPLGPLAMGVCRTLNVLMGMNAVDAPLAAENWLVAGGIGVYVAGITWFARREADQSSRLQLTLATVVMALGIALLAWFPSWSDRVQPLVKIDPQRWYLLTGALGLLIVWRCVWAVIEPIPARVRMAVAQAVLSIIMLDAVACYAIRGMPWAVMILLLLAPAMFWPLDRDDVEEMFFGYNTNGLAHHDLFDAVELLAEIGYQGVGITIDHNALPPQGPYARQRAERLRRMLAQRGMRSVIETGARYLLDPRVKHEPTLLSKDRRRRIDFTKYAIDLAAQLGSDCVSLWSGVLYELPTACPSVSHPERSEGSPPNSLQILRSAQDDIRTDVGIVPRRLLTPTQALDRLVEGLAEVLDYASQRGVFIGFEPEPGMLIDTMRAFETLLTRIDGPNLRLTLDIGHLHCQGETPIDAMIRRWASRLANVHIEDMRAGVHEHLMLGEGEIDFPPILRALAEVGYAGGVYVELSRHSRVGPEAARRSLAFLQNLTEG